MDLKNKFVNKNIFITGITGFKGSYMAYLLYKLGANVYGLGLYNEKENTAYHQLNIKDKAKVYYQDITKDFSDELVYSIQNADYIFHFAAQALVGTGIQFPDTTYETNIMGTIKILELIKNSNKEISLLNVASDRVYAPNNSGEAHTETDTLGGLLDPYSLSKVWQNQLIDSYRMLPSMSKNVKLYNVRTSNVIGGGDLGDNRLITTIENAYQNNTVVELRNPSFTRQYIYVLDCLCSYLYIAVYGKHNEYNVGSGKDTIVSVKDFVESCKQYYTDLEWEHTGEQLATNEGKALAVNTDRFHKEFSHIKKHIADNIDDVVKRTLEYNMSTNKEEYANTLVEEAITIYSL